MKNVIFFFALQLAWAAIWAQPGYEVIETPHWLNKKFVNAYSINLIGDTTDDAAQAWSALLLKAGGQKIKTLDGMVYHCENVTFPAISAQPFEVFFQAYGTGAESAFLTVWLKQGDKFLSTRGDLEAFKPVSRLLIQFMFDQEDQLRRDIRKDDIQRAEDLYPIGTKKEKG